jgi:hypothetical protein
VCNGEEAQSSSVASAAQAALQGQCCPQAAHRVPVRR